MELLNREFPEDCDVVVRREAERGTVRVMVRSRRPNPVWLAAYRSPDEPWFKVSADELRQGLLAAVKAEPGRGPSHYVRLPLHLGGVGGSQERKEKLLQEMVSTGELELRELAAPVGRRRAGLYLPGMEAV